MKRLLFLLPLLPLLNGCLSSQIKASAKVFHELAQDGKPLKITLQTVWGTFQLERNMVVGATSQPLNILPAGGIAMQMNGDGTITLKQK